MCLCHPAKSIWCCTLENKIERKNQYLIKKCIFLIYVVTITTESCYLQKLNLVKVIWDLLMVAEGCILWEATVLKPRACWENLKVWGIRACQLISFLSVAFSKGKKEKLNLGMNQTYFPQWDRITGLHQIQIHLDRNAWELNPWPLCEQPMQQNDDGWAYRT